MSVSNDPVISALSESFPERIPFYHLGEVALSDSPEPDAAAFADPDRRCLGFQLQGDVSGVVAVLFDADQDLSTYSELGNLLASRIATELSRRVGLDVLISPPRPLGMERLARMLQTAGQPHFRRTYLHVFRDQPTVPVQLIVVPILPSAAQIRGAARPDA